MQNIVNNILCDLRLIEHMTKESITETGIMQRERLEVNLEVW